MYNFDTLFQAYVQDMVDIYDANPSDITVSQFLASTLADINHCLQDGIEPYEVSTWILDYADKHGLTEPVD
jgi:hypothetical protein